MSDNLAFLLYGGMGAGKTTITREFAQLIGIKEKITSPTFVGLNEYLIDDRALYHFDLYQVAASEEYLRDLLIDHSSRKIFIFEWAENLDFKIYELLKANAKVFKIRFEVEEDESRALNITRNPI